ncbi:MAG: AraC family transcriptional regulator ligand-binding domain-containing protein [Moraxellaceae bacterium]|nr:AraC family transcriptional regulator ligand-binding domain-containing protein [Moraxellaceae bacterium]MDZ4386916.1 AraC family transcriptional regulator ligand-binding domain-containing protein [Moraxellaceae bacterium]
MAGSETSSIMTSRMFTIAAYPRKMLQLFESRWSIPAADLLSSSRLSAQQLERPDAIVPLLDVYLLFQEALKRCPEPPLSLRYAEMLTPTTHGLLGQATLTAPSVADVVALYYDYMAVVAPFLVTHRERRSEQQEALVFELMSDLPLDESFLMEVLVMAAFNILVPIAGSHLREVSLYLTHRPSPPYAELLQAHCHQTIHFNASFNGLGFSPDLLAQASMTANAEQHQLLIAQIQTRMSQLLADGSLADSIRIQLANLSGPFPRMEVMASELGLSVRTLRNRLSQQGTSFQILLEEARRTRACDMLKSSNASVKEIAYLLGYRESSNFSRVFKAWTGLAPLAWRSQQRQANA